MTDTKASPYEEFDHNAPRTGAELRQLHEEIREECPVLHSRQHGGFSLLTRYDDVRHVLHSPDAFSSADGVFIPPSGVPPVAAMEFDEPEHSMWRRILEPPLTLRAVRAFEPTITEVVDKLIDVFAPAGRADLVAQLAEPLPSILIGRLVGLDSERSLAARNVGAALFASIGGPQFEERMAEFAAFTEAQLAERRAEPRGDFLTEVASGTVDGQPVDADGATGLMIAYLLGGHHSTGSGIAGLLRHLLTEPGLKDAVQASPERLGQAVEESLRLNTPLQFFARTARPGAQAGGECLPAGSRVLLDLAAANRDPRRFDRPGEFDLSRARNPHVAFGGGLHICQGQHLARAELRIAAARILDRLPDVALAGEAPEIVAGGKLVTTATLPVRFTPKAQ